MKVKEYETDKFKAKYVSPEKAARHVELFPKLNKTKDISPLFVVHGFYNQPAKHLNNIADKWPRFTDADLKHYPILILWPCTEESGYISRYKKDQEDPSQRAGMELKAMVDANPNDLFPRKSLLMHSMYGGLGQFTLFFNVRPRTTHSWPRSIRF